MNEKQRRRQHRKDKKNRGGRRETLPPTSITLDQLEEAVREEVEQYDDPKLAAERLAALAMAAPTPEIALRYAKQALKLDPACVDALCVMTPFRVGTVDQLIQALGLIVKIGAQNLGADFFADHRGHFWGIFETRPYMRARAELAYALAQRGDHPEAIAHLTDMLDLNPNDNQALRYDLMGHYLMLDRLDDAKRLEEKYPNEGSAVSAWALVLRLFLEGDETGAEAALPEARDLNPYAEDYLNAGKSAPESEPAAYELRSKSGGVMVACKLGAAWSKHPAAVAWLRSRRRDAAIASS